jgi:hypothetical protein
VTRCSRPNTILHTVQLLRCCAIINSNCLAVLASSHSTDSANCDYSHSNKQDKIEGIHNAELAILSRSTNLRSALVSVLTATPAVVIVITLGLYSSLGNVLTPSKVSKDIQNT